MVSREGIVMAEIITQRRPLPVPASPFLATLRPLLKNKYLELGIIGNGFQAG
jgi:hypothetical protein